MQSGKVACITRELEDLLMIEEERGTLQKKNGSENVGMSSEKKGENPFHRKHKDS